MKLTLREIWINVARKIGVACDLAGKHVINLKEVSYLYGENMLRLTKIICFLR